MSHLPLTQFSSQDMQVKSRQTCYKGFFTFNKYHIQFQAFRGGRHEADFEVLEHPGAVCVLPYDPIQQKVLLVEQFRIGAINNPSSPWLFEAVAGIKEPGETLEAVAAREMEEEAQLTLLDLMPMFNCWLSPGCTTERTWLFCGKVNLANAAEFGGLIHESEDIKLHIVDVATAFAAIDEGKIMNAMAILALQWLQIHKADVDMRWNS